MEILLSLVLTALLLGVLGLLAWRFRAILGRNRGLLSVSGLTVLFTALFLLLFYRPPGSAIGPEQPIPFSHRLHAGVKNINCRYCHPYVERSIHPGIPPVAKCLHCHNYIITQHPEILKEHNYYNTDTPTPWRKVNYLAEHVLFNHQRHIRKQIDCRECHGAIESMDRIKGKIFYMEFCINCHREKKANLDCWLACHS